MAPKPKKPTKKKSVRQQITEGVKKAASKVKKKLQITYNRSTRQWERPKYMRKAEFERQLAEKEAIYTRRRARDVQHLFQRANERVSQLLASGLDSEALRKLGTLSRNSDSEGFYAKPNFNPNRSRAVHKRNVRE